jgi:lipoprotein NlpI
MKRSAIEARGPAARSVIAAGIAMIVATAPAIAGRQGAPELLESAMAEFRSGKLAESVASFDRLAKLEPRYGPYLWQRGIALYYAGRFEECRAQFESHRFVNPDDVENAAWHFLCAAGAESAAAARARILPVGRDRRTPMAEIYQMFLGKMTEAQVMQASGRSAEGLFFANLYTGLYMAATGAPGGRERIAVAAEPRFAAAGGYMHAVARVHLQQR